LREDWLINPRYIYRGLDKKKSRKKINMSF